MNYCLSEPLVVSESYFIFIAAKGFSVTKARRQAKFRGKIAVLFFIFLLINIVMKLFGFSTLDDSQTITASHALGMKVSYFMIPAFFLTMSLLFMQLSRSKSAEAESIEIGGCSW
ncbi:MAG: hypothetical protein ACJA0G_001098 [Kangiellaceae bacterium]